MGSIKSVAMTNADRKHVNGVSAFCSTHRICQENPADVEIRRATFAVIILGCFPSLFCCEGPQTCLRCWPYLIMVFQSVSNTPCQPRHIGHKTHCRYV